MIQYIIPALTSLIDKLFPNPAEAEAAKLEMMKELNKAQQAEIEATSNIVIAEAKGETKIQKTWRPFVALGFCIITLFLLVNNLMLFPILKAFGYAITIIPIPPELWYVDMVCIGGYIQSRGSEKKALINSEKNWFDAFRYAMGGSLPQALVDKVNEFRKIGK